MDGPREGGIWLYPAETLAFVRPGRWVERSRAAHLGGRSCLHLVILWLGFSGVEGDSGWFSDLGDQRPRGYTEMI